jgi:glutamate 5-kinase
MRRELLKNVKRIVVKIGSKVLTGDENDIDAGVISRLAGDIAKLRENGVEVIVVSSGAVAAGRKELGLSGKPRTIPQKQAAAAIGQSRLMRNYEEGFAKHGHKVAQILLTRDDLGNRQRFLNAQDTIATLLSFGIIPIINENDTVAVDEIKFGDNDKLSAMVANLVEAHLLVLLTDIEGFYDADPRINPEASLKRFVEEITKNMEEAAADTGSSVGTGGMATKLLAVKMAAKDGVSSIIINGKIPGALLKALSGEEIGTFFQAVKKKMNRRKHWIAYASRPHGRISVDKGAFEALHKHGGSLLPSGIVGVEGEFGRGACVKICGPDGVEFARGITNYSHHEIGQILGHKSLEIEKILGYRYGDEIIHRDNLVVL